MKSLLLATALLATSAFALFIPPSQPSRDDVAVAGSTAAHGSSVYFSVPCQGCFEDIDDELDIELKIESTTLACQTSAIVINDVRLSEGQSTILFKPHSINELYTQEMVASWEVSCLDGNLTLLSVRINEASHQPRLHQKQGFSASFRQGSSPEFLRLERTPICKVAEATPEQWAEPQAETDFVVVSMSSTVDGMLPNEFQDQLRRLYQIKAHIGHLHHKYMKQEQRIFEMIKQDFDSCSGAKCVFNTAIKTAPDFFELVKAHFRHRPDWSKLRGLREGLRKQGDSALMYDDADFQDKSDHVPSPFMDFVPEHTPLPIPFDKPHGVKPPSTPRPPPPPPHDKDHPSSLPPPPPPPPPPHHPHDDHHRQHDGRPSWAKHHPGHHKAHFLHRHGPHRHPFAFSIGSIFFFVIIAHLLFKCVQAKTGLFRNDRRRRDRAARREECQNRAAYRRAAMRHKWKRWWSHFRHPESTADYEEKRARLLDQEDTLEDVMQSEIRELRRAHEIVDDMVRAEETRQMLHHEANFGDESSSPVGSLRRIVSRGFIPGLRSSRVGSSSTTTSAYATGPVPPPPPPYDLELQGDMTVVDGFRYTPSATDTTPESSVVDCNSRMSFDTSTTAMKG